MSDLNPASHSTHHPSPPHSSRFNHHEDEIPRVSGIIDFDSPIENEREQEKVFGEARCVAACSIEAGGYGDEIPRFSGIADFDSRIGNEKEEKASDSLIEKDKESIKEKEKAFGEDKCDAAYPNDAGGFSDEISQYSGIPNFDSHIEMEKENTVKVKIQGRRRLCKAGTKNDDIDKVDEKEILEVVDFSSPALSKKAVDVVEVSGLQCTGLCRTTCYGVIN
ncbi:hypothetical protein Droror1_Dr00006417 [Drosera rotundifolia]